MPRFGRAGTNRQGCARPSMSDIPPYLRARLRIWAKESRNSVPNLDRLYSKMASEGADAHYVHAYYAKKLHESGWYRISDIGASTGRHDIDIQLDGIINIRVWYVMSTPGHVDAWLVPRAQKSDAIGRHMGAPNGWGDVPANFKYDEKEVRNKLARLPDDALGILLLRSACPAYLAPLPPDGMSANKCILNVNSRGSAAELRCSPAFSHREEIECIAKHLDLDLATARQPTAAYG